MDAAVESAQTGKPPFDQDKLDRLMDDADLDFIVAASKHNVQYLLGGYRFIVFSATDAIGHSRYLPLVIYEKGKPENAAYIGNSMEGAEHRNSPFWTPAVHAATWGSLDAAALAAEHFVKIGRTDARIGIEPSFLPSDAYIALRKALPEAKVFDATSTFERLRAVKTPEELARLRKASELIAESMLATIAAAHEGTTKAEIIEQLRREETNRGLQFDYCLLTMGSSHNRASSSQAWANGDILSIGSGGNHRGYIGDLCRMGILGEPDAELEDLLHEIDAIQAAAFSKIRAGAMGEEIIIEAEATLKTSPSAEFTDFFCHGMGLITHEAPFLMTNHPVTYEGVDADRPLEEGMVISVETAMLHPRRGFIKLEDTVAVTATGCEMFGDAGRGWNRGGSAA